MTGARRVPGARPGCLVRMAGTNMSGATTSDLTLAASAGSGDILTLFVWIVVAAIASLSGFYIAIAVRRWAQRDERAQCFTIQDLRELRARGQINDREFAAMRATLLAQFGDADENDATAVDDEPRPPDDRPTSPPSP